MSLFDIWKQLNFRLPFRARNSRTGETVTVYSISPSGYNTREGGCLDGDVEGWEPAD